MLLKKECFMFLTRSYIGCASEQPLKFSSGLFKVIIVLFLLCNTNNAQSQIFYNKAKPISYQSAELNQLNSIPEIEFSVMPDGNLTSMQLGINIQEKMLTEKYNDYYISRIKLKVNNPKIGLISLHFVNIELNNNSYCYVYTSDYKIVAGPIYKNSVNGFLNIMNIPANELVLEVVSDNEDDFNLKLDGVSYNSLHGNNKKIKELEHLMGVYDNCYTCTDNAMNRADNIINNDEFTCGWLGWGYPECFNMQKLKGINNYQYDIARASCIVMQPACETEQKYIGCGGTLINFPYQNCNNPDDCSKSFIIGCHHESAYLNIINAAENEDSDYLQNVLVRFNWHHKFGTPWHLSNVNCTTDVAAFELWRSSIDFDEVIDYCGVGLFAYGPGTPDVAIIKTQQKLIYKELHSGWSAQANYNIDKSVNPEIIQNDDFKLIGRRSHLPAQIINIYDVNLTNYSPDAPYSGSFVFKVADNSKGDIPPGSYSGYSSTQITIPDYDNLNQRIGLGMIHFGDDINRTITGGYSYYKYFYNQTLQIIILEMNASILKIWKI